MTAQATSPFLQPSAAAMLGLGFPIVNVFDVTALAAVGPTTITLPIPAPGATKLQVRIKTSAVNAATTILRGAVSVTDGTNTVGVQPARAAATAAGANFDENFDVYVDINVTSISFPVTLGGGTTIATINTEVYGNP
jgi:hypothetical protein